MDSRQVDQPAFGLGDDFVFDDEDVAGAEAGGSEEFVGKGIAWVDFGFKRDGDQAKFGRRNRSAFLFPRRAD